MDKGRIFFSCQEGTWLPWRGLAARISEVRVNDQESFLNFRKYIQQNPVKAGLADSAELYPYSYTYLAQKKPAGASRLRKTLQRAGKQHLRG